MTSKELAAVIPLIEDYMKRDDRNVFRMKLPEYKGFRFPIWERTGFSWERDIAEAQQTIDLHTTTVTICCYRTVDPDTGEMRWEHELFEEESDAPREAILKRIPMTIQTDCETYDNELVAR